MQPKTLLPILLGGAVGAGGILQGLHWRNAATEANSEELRGQITALENEIETLRTENQSLRSLVQGGGEVQVSGCFIEDEPSGAPAQSSVQERIGWRIRRRVAS